MTPKAAPATTEDAQNSCFYVLILIVTQVFSSECAGFPRRARILVLVRLFHSCFRPVIADFSPCYAPVSADLKNS